MAFPAATRIAARLKAAPRVVLATHVNADGDAVGGVLGLAHALRTSGRQAVVWPQPMPARYRFLPGFEEFAARETPPWRPGDVAVALDSADGGRLPEAVAAFGRAGGELLVVDHHASNDGFGKMNWVEAAAPSTTAMIWVILREMGIDPPPPTALCFYVGLVTDTGNFTFSNTNPWAFEMAADLCGRGVSPAAVERELYGRFPLSYMNLLGAALAGMKQADGVVYMSISQDALATHNAGADETEGMVDYARRVAGCRVGILFRELDDGGVKVSYRAAEDLDVRPLAVAHGGGGHAAAAGCRVQDSLEKVEALILAEALLWLRNQPAA